MSVVVRRLMGRPLCRPFGQSRKIVLRLSTRKENLLRPHNHQRKNKKFARTFDALGKVVFSSTLKHVEGNKTRIVRTNVAEEVLTLKEQPGKDIFIDSLSLTSQLSDRGLIDEYHFVIRPVIAGSGPRRLETLKPQNRLRM